MVLDQGSYAESPTLDVKGITIRGGFKRLGSAWERDCAADARLKTVIDSPTNVGLTVVDVAASLRTLSVLTKAEGASVADAPGESMYGVRVSGDAAVVDLVDVRVVAGKGGAGGSVTTTLPGASVSCDGVTDCAGGADAAGAKDGEPAPAGSFDSSGFSPGDGTDGIPGTAGGNGTVGTTGKSHSACMDQGCAGDCVSNCIALGSGHSVEGAHGLCGCGGQGGPAGGGGRGGGASIALFVSGKGVVKASYTELTAQDGGAGSSGHAGAVGKPGAAGAKGASKTCWGACFKPQTCGNCLQDSMEAAGGDPGGNGGKGSPGGSGGGGAGGPSISVVRLSGALVVLEDGSFGAHGKGGSGAGSAPAGEASDDFAVP